MSTCFAHPNAVATASCVECQRMICPLCAFSSPQGAHCPDCALSPRAEKPRLGGAITGVVFAAMAAALLACAVLFHGVEGAPGLAFVGSFIFGGIALFCSLFSADAARKADSGVAWAGMALSGATLFSLVFMFFVGLLSR